MRTISISALALLSACAAPQQTSDRREIASSVPAILLSARPETVAAGGEVTLTLSNRTDGVIGHNLCASALQRRGGGGWQPVPEDRVCTMELRALQPGADASEQLQLPVTLAGGEYRYTTTIERIDARTRQTVGSNPIRVSG